MAAPVSMAAPVAMPMMGSSGASTPVHVDWAVPQGPDSIRKMLSWFLPAAKPAGQQVVFFLLLLLLLLLLHPSSNHEYKDHC